MTRSSRRQRSAPSPSTPSTSSIRRVDESPGELTILAQAPLTNLADGGRSATRRSPPKVGHLYVMGGGEGNITPAAEYNFFVDPEAAKIVLNAGFPLTLFTWTLTKYARRLRRREARRIAALGTPLAEFFGQVNRKAREFDDKVNHLGGSTHPGLDGLRRDRRAVARRRRRRRSSTSRRPAS